MKISSFDNVYHLQAINKNQRLITFSVMVLYFIPYWITFLMLCITFHFHSRRHKSFNPFYTGDKKCSFPTGRQVSINSLYYLAPQNIAESFIELDRPFQRSEVQYFRCKKKKEWPLPLATGFVLLIKKCHIIPQAARSFLVMEINCKWIAHRSVSENIS